MTSQQQIDQEVKGLRFMGGKWASYSDEQLQVHVAAWFAAYEQTGMVLPINQTAGKTADEMMAEAQAAKVAKLDLNKRINRRYAGARALRNKYGDELAEKIIRNHKG